MSFIAAHTTRIGVGVSVLIMPYRNPVATAKSLATIDRMSGGRLIAGVSAGWNEAEFAALGVPFRERGARTNEQAPVMAMLSTAVGASMASSSQSTSSPLHSDQCCSLRSSMRKGPTRQRCTGALRLRSWRKSSFCRAP
jgi:alkanesulfonate monooxygenase SsuD/methylene tetrahydromethanopterin reductase-like flavin-dependent oxidoreductase (luciferase family)